jgi:hypothetical protein
VGNEGAAAGIAHDQAIAGLFDNPVATGIDVLMPLGAQLLEIGDASCAAAARRQVALERLLACSRLLPATGRLVAKLRSGSAWLSPARLLPTARSLPAELRSGSAGLSPAGLLAAAGSLFTELRSGAARLSAARLLPAAGLPPSWGLAATGGLLSELWSAATRLLSELPLLARSSRAARLPLSALLLPLSALLLPLLNLLALLPLGTRCAGRLLTELALARPPRTARLTRSALLDLLSFRSWPTRRASAELLLLAGFAARPLPAELVLSRSSRSARGLASSALLNLRGRAARLFSELLRLPLRLTRLPLLLSLRSLLLTFLLLVGVHALRDHEGPVSGAAYSRVRCGAPLRDCDRCQQGAGKERIAALLQDFRCIGDRLRHDFLPDGSETLSRAVAGYCGRTLIPAAG